MIDALKGRLIDDCRHAWRFASVRLHGAAILFAALYELMPVLSPEVAAMLPAPLQVKAVGLYAIAGLLARLTKQRSSGAAR